MEPARRSSLFFLSLSEALCWMHLPIFFQAAIFPIVFFRPESRYFFSVESTPENSHRHLVVELLITASLHVTRPICISLFLSSFPLFCLSPPPPPPVARPRISGYVRTAVAIVAFRALDCSTRTNETRPFAWCRLANGVASRRIASIGRGLQDYIDGQTLRCTLHMLEDYPARQYEITFVRQRLAAGGGVGLSLTRKAAPDKSERCFWHEFSRETEKKTP